MMADHQEIKTTAVPMKQWRIDGTDGARAVTITAYRGEYVEQLYADPYRANLTANLASVVAEALAAAAEFVEVV